MAAASQNHVQNDKTIPVQYSSIQERSKERSYPHRWITVAVPLCISLILGVALLGVGTHIFVKYRPQDPDSLKLLGHRNDTILLKGNVDSFWSSNVTVHQCVQQGDASHVSYVYIVKSEENLRQNVASLKQSPVYYQDSPSYKSGILDYLYLLPESNFTYRICLASTTSQRKNATYFLFNDIEKYWDYVNANENGLKNSILSKRLVANGNNQTACTEIAFNVTESAYYFMMILSPADIVYSYNFTLNKVTYNTRNASQICKVSDFNTCEVKLLSKDFKHENYDILAHIQPSDSGTSLITHLCLTAYSGSSTLRKIFYISSSLLGVGALLLVSTSLIFVCVVALRVRKKCMHKGAEQQKLLYKY